MAAIATSPITVSKWVSQEHPITLTVPKDPAWFSVARLAGAGVAVNAGLSFDAVEDVKIIVTEACAYCVEHGQPGGELIVSFDAADAKFVVTVEDRAFPVLMRPAEPEAEASIAIDGLLLIRGLADNVEFLSGPDGGLALRITKAIGAQ